MDPRRAVLAALDFGHEVAEDEADQLSSYFVETQQWADLYSGSVDVVYGGKGAGKSALYILLDKRSDELRKGRKIVTIQGEDPRGTPVFQDLVPDPPATEQEFRSLWKLYFLTLIGQLFQKTGASGPDVEKVVSTLVDAKILAPSSNRKAILRAAHQYVREALRWESVEAGVSVDPATMLPRISGKIVFREPTEGLRQRGFISVNDLLARADHVLQAAKGQIWILLDRLDVAFQDSEDLEANALRALFRAYRDMGNLPAIKIKIFMRSDIWRRITDEGFREASHIERHIDISWSKNSLLNLVVRRLLRSSSIREFYKVDESTLDDIRLQEEFFYRVFPGQVDAGARKPRTLDWMLGHTADGTKTNTPRELLQLLRYAKDEQMRHWEVGEKEPEGEHLFERATFREALQRVSTFRLERSFLAEYPSLREFVLRLRKEKTNQSPDSLAGLWGVDRGRAIEIASKLVDAGFFEERGSKDSPQYWVPFVYRGALQMVQGAAES